MKKWYKESYFNRTNWILENYEKLDLSDEETLLLLIVELNRISKGKITYEYLRDKMRRDPVQIDRIIASLVNKRYLKLTANSRGLVFDIDPIFEFDPERYDIIENSDLYDVVTEVFGKPLSPSDLQKMNELIAAYGEKQFKQALRIAEAQKKLKMSYIEGILRNEKKQQADQRT